MHIQHADHRLGNVQCATQGTDSCEDMSEVRPLSSMGLRPPSLPTPLQKQIEQTLFSTPASLNF